jgi:ribosomal protein L11 methyltransferase
VTTDDAEEPTSPGLGGTARWTRVAVTAPTTSAPSTADVAADLLWTAGAAGIEERDDGSATTLIGGFADAADAADAAARATRLGFAASVSTVVDDGLDAWREWAAAEQAGPFWITPTWVDPPEVARGERVLWIDPGPTFGSGSHPTTRLVLALLADLVTPGATVLDAGCGSGVLAVGAALCGAGTVVATDIDPASPEITRANAERNGVTDRIRATTEPVAALASLPTGGGAPGPDDERFDVVAANLLAPVIADLGPDLVACVADGGRLVVSGLLADRWEASMPALRPLTVDQVVEEDGWVAVVLR